MRLRTCWLAWYSGETLSSLSLPLKSSHPGPLQCQSAPLLHLQGAERPAHLGEDARLEAGRAHKLPLTHHQLQASGVAQV